MTQNVSDATPISVFNFILDGTTYPVLKTADGQNFISVNQDYNSTTPNKVEYTSDVILNYQGNGRNGTFATLSLVKTGNSYIIHSIGSGVNVIWGSTRPIVSGSYPGTPFDIVLM